MSEIPFLREDDRPCQMVRCPVHGFIAFSRNERRVIDHPVFQRLRHVRQLALEYLVYPAPCIHVEHSLGVMELPVELLKWLCESIAPWLKKSFSEFQNWKRMRCRARVRSLIAAEKYIQLVITRNCPSMWFKVCSEKLFNVVFFDGATDLMARILEKSKDTGFCVSS